MPRWSTSPPAATTAARDDVPPIDDGRCAGDQHEPGARIERASDGAGYGSCVVVAAGLVHDMPPQCFDARPEHPGGLVEHRLLRRRQPGLDEGCGHRLEGREAQRRLRSEDRKRAIENLAGYRERNHLDRRQHLALAYRSRTRQGRDGQRLVDGVEPIDIQRRDEKQTVGRREDVAASGKWRAHPARGGPASACAAACAASSSATSPASIRAPMTSPTPSRSRSATSAAPSTRPFLKVRPPARRPCASTMPAEFRDAEPAEPHARGRMRKPAVSSAAIDAAISAAVTAPISSPMGAWILASASGPIPAAVSRSMRRACVRAAPEAADVKRRRGERHLERGIVELRIVGQRHHGAARVELRRAERVVGASRSSPLRPRIAHRRRMRGADRSPSPHIRAAPPSERAPGRCGPRRPRTGEAWDS